MTDRARLRKLRKRIRELQDVCAEAYQMAGALGAPTLALDKLSAAASGREIPTGTYLPVCTPVTEAEAELAAANASAKAAPNIVAAMLLRVAKTGEHSGHWSQNETVEEATRVILELRADLERERVRLAGCSVAALGWAKGEQRAEKGSYGYSASYQDVVDLWGKYEAAKARIERLEGALRKELDELLPSDSELCLLSQIWNKEYVGDPTKINEHLKEMISKRRRIDASLAGENNENASR